MAMHHGALAHADQHRRHGQRQQCVQSDGDIETCTYLRAAEQSDDTKQGDDHADAKLRLRGVMARHGHIILDLAHMSECLRGDGDKHAEHDGRQRCE